MATTADKPNLGYPPGYRAQTTIEVLEMLARVMEAKRPELSSVTSKWGAWDLAVACIRSTAEFLEAQDGAATMDGAL